MNELMQALDDPGRFGQQSLSLQSMMLSILLAFVLGQLIAWIYAWSHTGLSYSRSFTQSLLLMTLVVSLIMYVIGSSIITAFGLLGALALIRFRNVLKDTRDTVFVFISLVMGMAVGSQRYMTAIVGTLALGATVLYLKATSFGTIGRYDGYLTCQIGDGAAGRTDLIDLLRRFCKAVKEVSTRQSGGESASEVVWQIGLRDRARGAELLNELRRLEGVQHVSLVMRSELSEV